MIRDYGRSVRAAVANRGASRRNWLAWLLLLGVLVFPRSAFAQASELATEIDAVTQRPEYKAAHWGMLIVDAKTGEVLFERGADQLFAPASVTKLFSCAAILDAYGGAHRFQTPVYIRGEVDTAGTLVGDVILVASGDPTMAGRSDEKGRITFKNSDHTYASPTGSAELTEPEPLAGLQSLARQVADSGIRRIRGEILIDDRLFDRALGTGSGPAKLIPIMINDNVVDFVIKPGKDEGLDKAKIDWRPKSLAYGVDASVDTVAAGKPISLTIRSSPRGYSLRGQIPQDKAQVVVVAEVDDPVQHARGLFIEALWNAGVRTTASPLIPGSTTVTLPSSDSYGKLRRVGLLTSPPLSESVKLTLKVSHNLHASTYPLLLAVKNGERSLAAGMQRQKELLKALGVETEKISFGGGAGGDRADFVTPRATCQLLQAMAKHKEFSNYRLALPVLGEDGTLAKAVASDSPAKGNVFAKTGTFTVANTFNATSLLTAKSLAGYATTASGREVAFACFVNLVPLERNEDREAVGKALGKIAEAVYKKL